MQSTFDLSNNSRSKAMVPDRASHKLFWKRYFFKVHLIELQEARRQMLKKRAEQATKEAAESGECSFSVFSEKQSTKKQVF